MVKAFLQHQLAAYEANGIVGCFRGPGLQERELKPGWV